MLPQNTGPYRECDNERGWWSERGDHKGLIPAGEKGEGIRYPFGVPDCAYKNEDKFGYIPYTG